jgi:hypothetical protein
VPSIAALERDLARSLGRHVSVTVEYFPSRILTSVGQESEAEGPEESEVPPAKSEEPVG